jgi:hypothetical protein
MTAQRCDNCHFSKPSGYANYVQCRRFPPSVDVTPGKQYRTAPLVRDNAWCGEWRKHGDRPSDAEPETPRERLLKTFRKWS